MLCKAVWYFHLLLSMQSVQEYGLVFFKVKLIKSS